MALSGKEHPVLGAAVNMVSWPMNIPAYFANAKQAAKNLVTGKDELDPLGQPEQVVQRKLFRSRLGEPTGRAQGEGLSRRGAPVQRLRSGGRHCDGGQLGAERLHPGAPGGGHV